MDIPSRRSDQINDQKNTILPITTMKLRTLVPEAAQNEMPNFVIGTWIEYVAMLDTPDFHTHMADCPVTREINASEINPGFAIYQEQREGFWYNVIMQCPQ